MAGKRQATSDLNHDNWDREEEPEERGIFRTATEDELKNRVIKKAKRKIAPAANTDTADGGSATKSVFSGFSGFGKPPSSAATTSSAAFSFLNKIPAIAAVTSSDVSSSTTTSSSTPTFSFGSGLAMTTTNAKTTENPRSSLSFGNSVDSVAPSAPKISTTPSDSSYFSEYHKKLSTLNQAVCEWVKTHVDKNPVCILSPIFKDYEKYLEEIEKEKKKVGIKNAPSITTEKDEKSTANSMGSFKFSVNSTDMAVPNINTGKATAEAETKTNGLGFELKKSDDTSLPKSSSGFSFNLKTPTTSSIATTSSTTSGFSFGSVPLNSSQSNAPSKPFSFTPGGTPFSFANIKPPNASAATAEVDPNEDGDDEPPKNEFKQVVEDDAVYSKKCKVFVKKDGNFVDKGVGTLYLKPIESSGKTQLLVRADTNLGNILVNLILNSAIPAQRMGKNNVMLVCLPTPDIEKPTSMLLRVKTAEEADELLENIDKYKK